MCSIDIEDVFNIICNFEPDTIAAVDSFGAEALASLAYDTTNEVSLPIYRLHCFLALFLSPRTKDQQTAQAMKNLRSLPGGVSYITLCNLPEDELATVIKPAGFAKTKAKNLKKCIKTFIDEYNCDIPKTYAELISLPGVGPKIALLVLQCAWNDCQGIAVDTHVHRVSNRVGFVDNTSSAEKTRIGLERVFPKPKWKLVNLCLVRFGQTVCLPKTPKCRDCPVGQHCPSFKVEEPAKKSCRRS
ncbi:hypothetical protein P9112_014162 [Eukaryota sp. TZLM1-RC]